MTCSFGYSFGYSLVDGGLIILDYSLGYSLGCSFGFSLVGGSLGNTLSYCCCLGYSLGCSYSYLGLITVLFCRGLFDGSVF